MNQQNLLAQLKDIHQPQPVSWWPPAYGWYILVALILIIGFIVGKSIYKYWRKKQRKKYALNSLNQLKQAYMKHHDTQYIAKAAVLLKRTVMTKYTRRQVATLTDENWLLFLDSISKSTEYSNGIGRKLLTLPYQEKAAPAEELFDLLEKTMNRCL